MSLQGKGRGEGGGVDLLGRGTRVAKAPGATSGAGPHPGQKDTHAGRSAEERVRRIRDGFRRGAGLGYSPHRHRALHQPLLFSLLGPEGAPELEETGFVWTGVGTQHGHIQAGSPNSCRHPAITSHGGVMKGSWGHRGIMMKLWVATEPGSPPAL